MENIELFELIKNQPKRKIDTFDKKTRENIKKSSNRAYNFFKKLANDSEWGKESDIFTNYYIMLHNKNEEIDYLIDTNNWLMKINKLLLNKINNQGIVPQTQNKAQIKEIENWKVPLKILKILRKSKIHT